MLKIEIVIRSIDFQEIRSVFPCFKFSKIFERFRLKNNFKQFFSKKLFGSFRIFRIKKKLFNMIY